MIGNFTMSTIAILEAFILLYIQICLYHPVKTPPPNKKTARRKKGQGLRDTRTLEHMHWSRFSSAFWSETFTIL